MKPQLLSLSLIALSACSSATQNVKEFPEIDIPTSAPTVADIDIELPEFDVTFEQEHTKSAFSTADFSTNENSYVVAESRTPETTLTGPVKLPEQFLGRLELPNSNMADVSKALVADSFGMALVLSLSEEVAVSFSGGPFTQEAALLALEDLARSQSLTFKRNGNVILISDGSQDTGVSVGYTRVYRASASDLADAVNNLQGGATVAAVGRSVAVSGSSSAVSEALSLVQKFDRDVVSSYPWALVSVSPSVAAQAESLVLSLETDSSPISATLTRVGDENLVLVVAQDNETLSTYVGFLKSIEKGLPRKYLKTLPVQNVQTVLQALNAVYAAEIEDKSIVFSSTENGELWVRGNIELVGETIQFLEHQNLVSQYVELRAVVAETTRGSAIDRAVTLGLTPDFLNPVQITSTGGAPTFSLNSGGFGAALSWLDSDGQTRLLSTPRLSVISGGEASLKVGSQVPVLGSSSVGSDGRTTQDIQYKDVGVVLNVEPVLQSDGRLKVRIVQELSTAGTNTLTSLDSPLFESRSMETELVFQPGEIVSAAGLDFATQERGNTVLSTDASVSSRKLVILMTGTLPNSAQKKIQVQSALDEIHENILGAAK
jgi:type II secretory pathway component GspD/PulD (secretin)